MKNIIPLCLILGFSVLFLVSPASAITMGFDAPSATIAPGGSLNVAIFISDLGSEIVSAYDLFVGYDPAVLSATHVAFSTFLGGPLNSLQSADLSTPGVINFAELSFLSDDILDSEQPDTFDIGLLSFDVLSPGSSVLSFQPHPIFDVIDVKGLDAGILEINAQNATVKAVPEPGTIVSLSTGLTGFLLWKGLILSRRRKKSS